MRIWVGTRKNQRRTTVPQKSSQIYDNFQKYKKIWKTTKYFREFKKFLRNKTLAMEEIL